MALTAKQKRFCEIYVGNGYNGTQAYMSAYPDASYETANVESAKLKKKQPIRDYIHELEKDVYEELGINAERIARELASMAYAPIESDGLVKPSDKARALDLLQKQLGLQTQKVQASTEQSIKITIKQKEKDDGEV